MKDKKTLTVGIIIGVLVTTVGWLGSENIRLRKIDEKPDARDTTQTDNIPAITSIDDDPYLGDIDKATVAIVEFSDYECPFCKRFHDTTFNQIIREYVDTGKVVFVFRDYPLDFHNPAASIDATAANCTKELGDNKKYFEMNKLLYANSNLNGQGIPENRLIELAAATGVDKNDFSRCLESDKYLAEIQKDLDDGSKAGVEGTPGFVIGKLKPNGNVVGELVAGAQPFATFQEVVERQLKK